MIAKNSLNKCLMMKNLEKKLICQVLIQLTGQELSAKLFIIFMHILKFRQK